MSATVIKRFYVIQGDKRHEAGGYSTACQLAQKLMDKNKQPCKVEVEFLKEGWGMQLPLGV